MTPQDAATIRDVFAKIRAMGTSIDDAAATRLVEDELRANPAAGLNLVRVLVGLEQERDQFAAHVDELNAYIDQIEAQLAEATRGAGPGPQSGGLFGGSTRGSPWEQNRGVSGPGLPRVDAPPPYGADPRAAAQPSPRARGDAGTASPWGQPAPQQGQGQGSGFWGSALRTGAGVAGGLVAFEAMKGLFGGSDKAEARESGRHGFFGSEHEERRDTSGGFGGEEPTASHEPLIADNIDFFGGGDAGGDGGGSD